MHKHASTSSADVDAGNAEPEGQLDMLVTNAFDDLIVGTSTSITAFTLNRYDSKRWILYQGGLYSLLRFRHQDSDVSFITEVGEALFLNTSNLMTSDRAGGFPRIRCRIRVVASIYHCFGPTAVVVDAVGGEHQAIGIQADENARRCSQAGAVYEYPRYLFLPLGLCSRPNPYEDSHVLPPEIEDIFRRVQDSAHYMPDL